MSEKLLVRYKNETFDITNFVDKHPGGREALLTASNSDIDFKFDVAVPHSAAAKYLLREYLVSSHEFEYGYNSDNKTNDRGGKAVRKIDDGLIKTDESMEVFHVVDSY